MGAEDLQTILLFPVNSVLPTRRGLERHPMTKQRTSAPASPAHAPQTGSLAFSPCAPFSKSLARPIEERLTGIGAPFLHRAQAEMKTFASHIVIGAAADERFLASAP